MHTTCCPESRTRASGGLTSATRTTGTVAHAGAASSPLEAVEDSPRHVRSGSRSSALAWSSSRRRVRSRSSPDRTGFLFVTELTSMPEAVHEPATLKTSTNEFTHLLHSGRVAPSAAFPPASRSEGNERKHHRPRLRLPLGPRLGLRVSRCSRGFNSA